MKLHFFFVPAQDPAIATDELNRLLASSRVVAVDRELIQDGPRSGWAVCVTVAEGQTAKTAPAAGVAPKVDYKEVLPAEQFAVFAKLRELRKEIAEREKMPPYAVFNNEQLALMVRGDVRTSAQLGALPGVGPARVEKYGTAFLELLASCRGKGA